MQMSKTPIHHFVGGRIAAPRSSRAQDVFNPATGAATGSVALANRADVDAAAHFALRICEDLAVLGGDEVRELVLVLVEQVEKLEHHARPADRRRVGPGREGGLRGGHGSRDLRGVGQADLAGHGAGGGVGHVLAAAGGVGGGLAADEMIDGGGHGEGFR